MFMYICQDAANFASSDQTRTTRTPAFWDTPVAPWLPILVIHIKIQVKTNKVKASNFKKLLKIQILQSCKNFARDTFSEFAW